MWIRVSTRSLLIAAVLSGAACSPAVYKEQIGEFSKAMKGTKSAFDELVDQEHQATIEVDVRAALAETSGKLISGPKCGLGAAKSCWLKFQYGEKTEPFPQKKLGDNTSALLKTMVDYADGLAAVAGSEDADAVNEAAGKLSSAIARLPKAAGKTSTKIDAGVGFLEGAFKWIVGAYVDQKRFRALQRAVAAADPHVNEASTKLKETVMELLTSAIDNRADRLRKGSELFNRTEPPSLEPVEKVALAKALAEEVQVTQALADKKPDMVIDKMIVAHTALKKALMDESGQYEIVFMRIHEFADEVASLRKALK